MSPTKNSSIRNPLCANTGTSVPITNNSTEPAKIFPNKRKENDRSLESSDTSSSKPVSDYGARFPKDKKIIQYWEKEGVSYIENSRTKQQMPHYFQFYRNFKENEERLTIKNAVSKIKIPHLIIHGAEDDVVLLKEAKNLHVWNPKSKLNIIKEMNHSLGNTQPWHESKMPNHMQQVVKISIDFILDK